MDLTHRFSWLLIVLSLFFAVASEAATGRVIKVLPQFLDEQGRASLSPSLFERDAYQTRLREQPEKRFGIQFAVQWKTKGTAWEPLTLQVEMRGTAQGSLPKEKVLHQNVRPGGWFSHWSYVVFKGAQYKEFGEVTSWRVTLWEGKQLIGEQRSFLW